MPDSRRDRGPIYARDWEPQGAPRRGAAPDHERRSKTRPGWVLGIVALLGVLVLIMHYALIGLLAGFQHRPANWSLDPQYLSPLTNGRLQVPPAPRLQAAPEDELRALRAQEQTTLRTYGWVDPQRGTVRIPIDRAETLLLQRGLPHVPGASSAPRPDALRAAPFPNNGTLLGGETPVEGGQSDGKH